MLTRLLVSLTAALCLTGSLTAADTSVTKSLNDNIRKQAREESTGWQGLFDAYLDMTDPPMEIGDLHLEFGVAHHHHPPALPIASA